MKEPLRVLIVDDERIIREGLAFGVNWERVGMRVIGLADDGQTAFERIKEFKPDVVITDIKMPGMDGLELVRKAREEIGEETEFVLLSGYSEFSFAQEGIKLGIRDYLLKPTDTVKIYETMDKIRARIEERTEKRKLQKEMSERLEKQSVLMREQFLRDYITNSYVDQKDFDYYKEYFDFDNKLARVVLLDIGYRNNVEMLFSLKQLAEMYVDKNELMLCFGIKDQIILLLEESVTDERTKTILSGIKDLFHKFFDCPLHMVYTQPNNIAILPYIYRKINKCTKYGMYLSDEYIISMEETLSNAEGGENVEPKSFDGIIGYITSGDIENTKKSMDEYFYALYRKCPDIDVAKTYLTELYMSIIRCHPRTVQKYINEIIGFAGASGSLNEIKKRVYDAAIEIAEKNYEITSDKYSRVIKKALEYIDENLGDEELSMKNICNNVLFINIDYFGRLFKKEIGEKFTDYVSQKRIERAREIIENGEIENIKDVAETVGFGDGAQYFSHVFKKFTGFTPSEYKEKII